MLWFLQLDKWYVLSYWENLSNSNKTNRNIIVMLLPAVKSDSNVIERLIFMADNYLDDNKETDIVIMHNGFPDISEIYTIRNLTTRFIDFINIDHEFERIPIMEDFDPYINTPTFRKRGTYLLCL